MRRDDALRLSRTDIHDYDGLRRLPGFRQRVGNDLVRVF